MRYLIALLILALIFIVFRFFYKPAAIDYPVEARSASVLAETQRQQMRYHVNSVYRFIGADLYRGEGYFTYKAADLNISLFGKKVVKTENGLRKTIPGELVKGYELTPVFGFWEQYGKWVLLLVLLTIMALVLKRK